MKIFNPILYVVFNFLLVFKSNIALLVYLSFLN